MTYSKELHDKCELLIGQRMAVGYDKVSDLLDEIERLQKTQSAASILGSIKSERKSKSSAENGKKGGRPKKVV